MSNQPPAPTYDKTVTHADESIANPPSFISRLPNETLEAIFICGARDYHSKYLKYRVRLPTRTPPSWVNVSYVCRHWRNIALNRPTLWTYLFITSPRWTEELLSRSKQAPLRLYVDITGYPIHWIDEPPPWCFLKQVVKHLERIEELRLFLPFGQRNEEQVLSKLFSRAPRLKTLKISTISNPSDWKWPSVLFDGDTPALRTLDLFSCPLPWYVLNLSGLTTLNLRFIPVRYHQTIVEFLSTLRCMQGLRYLYLQKVLPSAAGFLSSPAFYTFQKIDLPRLCRLWIDAPLSTVITLLSCVTIPLKTEVRLECALEHGPFLDDYASLSSLLAQRLKLDDPAPCAPAIRSLGMAFWHDMVILTFNASERGHDFRSMPPFSWGCNVPMQIVITFGTSMIISGSRWSDRDPVINDICCSIPLPNVQTLCVTSPPSSRAFWRKTLGHLQDLRYLIVSGGLMPDLASLLSFIPGRHDHIAENDQYAERSPGQMLAPALEELQLHKTTFSTSRRNRNVPSASVQLLYNALSSRRESRGQLEMVRCIVPGHDHHIELDMVGRWEGGHFHVVEESSRPHVEFPILNSESDSDSLGESSAISSGFDSGWDSESPEESLTP